MRTYMTSRGPGAIQLLLISFIVITACTGNDPERNLNGHSAKTDSIEKLLLEERRINDSLRALINMKNALPPSRIVFGNEFREMENPEEHIISALREQPELIPLNPVLGGTMEFRSITLLSDKWVMAYYDDGHVEGKSIYEFALRPEGAVEFNIVTTDHPE